MRLRVNYEIRTQLKLCHWDLNTKVPLLVSNVALGQLCDHLHESTLPIMSIFNPLSRNRPRF